jgi:hypothetical protein
MTALYRSALATLCVLCAGACGGARHAETCAPVTTTSGELATTSGGPASAPALDDERRRADDAERRADAAERARAGDRSALRALLERDMVLQAAWSQLDRIDDAIRELKAEIPRASAKRRGEIQKAVRDATSRRGEVDKALHQVHALSSEDWPTFVAGMVAEIQAIEDELEAGASSGPSL